MGHQLRVQRRDMILQLILNKHNFEETHEYRFNHIIKYFKLFELENREIDDLKYIILAFIEKLIVYFNHGDIQKYLKALLPLFRRQIDRSILRTMGEHLLINLNNKVHDLVKEQLWQFYLQMLQIATTQDIQPESVYSLDEMTLIKFVDHIQSCQNMLLQKLELQVLHSMFPKAVQNLTETLQDFFPENSALQYALSAFIKNPFKTSWRGFMNCLNVQDEEIFLLPTLFIAISGKHYGLNKEDERTYVDFNCSKYTITFNILTENTLKPVSISIQNRNIESIFAENVSSLNAAEVVVTFKNTINVDLLNHSDINYISFRFNTKYLQDMGINKKDSFLYMFFGKLKVFRDATQHSLSQFSQDIIFSTPTKKQEKISCRKGNKIKVLSNILISNNSIVKQLENNGEIALFVDNNDSCDSDNLLTYLSNESMLLVKDQSKNSETHPLNLLANDVHASYSSFAMADSRVFNKSPKFDATSGWFSKENYTLSNWKNSIGKEFSTNLDNIEVSELNLLSAPTKTTESCYHTAECHDDNREVDVSTTTTNATNMLMFTAPECLHSVGYAELVNKSGRINQRQPLAKNVDQDITKRTINNANNKLCETLEEFNFEDDNDKEVGSEVDKARENRQLLQNHFSNQEFVPLTCVIDKENVEHTDKMESIQEYFGYYMDSELSSPDIPCEVISLPVFTVNCAKNYDVPCIEIEIIPSWITCPIDNTNQVVISKSQTRTKFKLKRKNIGNDIEKISISRSYKRILKDKPAKHEELRGEEDSPGNSPKSVRKLVLADMKKRKCVVKLKKVDIFKMEQEYNKKFKKQDNKQLRTVLEEISESENRIVRQEFPPQIEPLNNLSASELQTRSTTSEDISVVLYKSTKKKRASERSKDLQKHSAKRNISTKYKQIRSSRVFELNTSTESSDENEIQDKGGELSTVLEEIDELEDMAVRQESPPQNEPLNNLITSDLQSRSKSMQDVSLALDKIKKKKRTSEGSKVLQQQSADRNVSTKYKQMPALNTARESSDGNENQDRKVPNATHFTYASMELCTIREEMGESDDMVVRQESPPQTEPLNLSTRDLQSRWQSTEDVSVVLDETTKESRTSGRSKVFQEQSAKLDVSTKHKQIRPSRVLALNSSTESSDGNEGDSPDSLYKATRKKKTSERLKVTQHPSAKRDVSTRRIQPNRSSRVLALNTSTESSDGHEETSSNSLSSIRGTIPRKSVSSSLDKTSKQAEALSRRKATLKNIDWIRKYINMHSVKRHKAGRKLRAEVAEHFREILDEYEADIGFA